MTDTFESILVVYQNPAPGRQEPYDHWYTNVHIRDAMKLDGAIATQRFIVGDEQPVLGGKAVTPGHWAHTIYEWESAQKSVDGHNDRAGTPLMPITRDGRFENLRDFFYRPEHLSHGWTQETGFRRGTEIMTVLIVPPAGGEKAFIDWFRDEHAPDTLALAGFGSAALFSLHEAQSLPYPADYPMVAIYGLTDRPAALPAWATRHDAGSPLDIEAQAERFEIGCWQPRIERLLARDVVNADAATRAREDEARARHADSYLTRDELSAVLSTVAV